MSTSPTTSSVPSLSDLYDRAKRLCLDLRAYHLEDLDDSVKIETLDKAEQVAIELRGAIRSRVNRVGLEAGEGESA